ncbi:hypothetical protein [Azospirillum endophyticum]|uniref:hypothetical protein n=1 Tax=Azospirillum endophyticum TaxID=2800326 RepID=UPI001FFF235C|nr:hypothetical protein [Azospirillum endophyticum]
MAGAITDYNGPNVTLAGGSALKKFMESTSVAAKKKIEDTGNIEGFKAGFTSADGEISVKITSKAMTDDSRKSGYGLFYEVDTKDGEYQVSHGAGVQGITDSGDGVDSFLSSMDKMNAIIGTKSSKMTEEEELQYVKDNFPSDQYEKVVQGIKKSKAAYEAQQRELRGEKGDASSPALDNGTRLDRMKARSEDGAQLAERLLKGVTGRDQSEANGTAHWLASSLTDPAADKSSAQTADKVSPPPSYKPVDLKT